MRSQKYRNAPSYSLAVRLDPTKLLHDYVPNAIQRAIVVHRIAFPPSTARRKFPGAVHHPELSILCAVTAVQLFRRDPERKRLLRCLRREERVASRRRTHPARRLAKAKDIDGTTSVELLREQASELNVDDANRLLSLMWLAFTASSKDESFETVCSALQRIYEPSRSQTKIEGAVQKQIKRCANTEPTNEERRHYKCSTIDQLAKRVFRLWSRHILDRRMQLATK